MPQLKVSSWFAIVNLPLLIEPHMQNLNYSKCVCVCVCVSVYFASWMLKVVEIGTEQSNRDGKSSQRLIAKSIHSLSTFPFVGSPFNSWFL